MTVKKIKSYLIHDSQGIIIFFVLKLFIFFFLFDYFFLFLIGASIEGGIFVSVLENFNLAEMYRDFLLQLSGFLVTLLGYDYTISGKHLFIPEGGGIILGFSCYGFSIISVYLALILAYPKSIKVKIIFLIGGVVAIILMNALRIAILTIVFTEVSRDNVPDLDHHTIFNVIVYIMIFGIFYWFVNKKEHIQSKSN